jgi:pimeloyl-ACP methyl ester carboxylesterase
MMVIRKPAGGGPAHVQRLRRAYHECRYGQLHLHNTLPAGGGFDELTPVVCLHGQGQTGRVFASLLPALGNERSLYAPDLPGRGESDPAPGVEPVAAAAFAVWDFIVSMRIRCFDVIARGEGCGVARLLVSEHPQAVRRLVLIADPVLRALSTLPVLVVPAAEDGTATLAARIESFLAG